MEKEGLFWHWRPFEPEVQVEDTRGLSKHAEIVKEEHDYQSKVPSASDRFNNQSQHRQRKGVYGLHMLYREEKPVIEAAEVPMSSTAKVQKNTNQSPQINV